MPEGDPLPYHTPVNLRMPVKREAKPLSLSEPVKSLSYCEPAKREGDPRAPNEVAKLMLMYLADPTVQPWTEHEHQVTSCQPKAVRRL